MSRKYKVIGGVGYDGQLCLGWEKSIKYNTKKGLNYSDVAVYDMNFDGIDNYLQSMLSSKN